MRGEFIDVNGARLYYYAAGSRGVGEPVVFLHGFPTSSHLWTEVVPLVPKGHRVVVVDLLGYGRSDRPAGRDSDELAIRVAAGRDDALRRAADGDTAVRSADEHAARRPRTGVDRRRQIRKMNLVLCSEFSVPGSCSLFEFSVCHGVGIRRRHPERRTTQVLTVSRR